MVVVLLLLVLLLFVLEVVLGLQSRAVAFRTPPKLLGRRLILLMLLQSLRVLLLL